MTDVRTDFREVEALMHDEGGVRVTQETGVLTAEEANRVIQAMRQSAATGHFLWAMTSFITAGRKP